MIRALFVLFCWMSVAYAGAVNSPGSFPLAAMNASGDAIFAGDYKIRASWKGAYSDRREAAASFRFSDTAAELYSGGIAEAHSNADEQPEAVGIVCSRKRATLFLSQRSASNPSGSWREINSLAGVSLGSEEHSCAMRADGLYAIHLEKVDVFCCPMVLWPSYHGFRERTFEFWRLDRIF